MDRDKAGKLSAPLKDAGNNKQVRRESFIHIHVTRIDDAARRAEVVQALEQMLGQVRAAVTDWKPMLGRVGEVIAELKANPPPLPVDDIAEKDQQLLPGKPSSIATDLRLELDKEVETAVNVSNSINDRWIAGHVDTLVVRN